MYEDAQKQSRRVALLLEYDGAGYAGSQYQENALTVQSVLEDAIEQVTGERVRAAFAGRTDAGVHACGQVASFVTTSALEAPVLRRALNARLPDDVVVREATDVASDFDPRRQALRRHYRYLIDNGAVRSALGRERAWYVSRPLDCDAMQTAAASITGRHDFSAFASPLDDRSASTVRELFCFDVRRQGDRLTLDATANAFLPHQVRRMVGALVDVGKGRRTPAEYASLLEEPAASVGPAAPAHGLYLMDVEYASPVFGVVDSATEL